MESYHGNQNSVKNSLRLINNGANLVTRDQAEQLLHADDMIGQWLTGDVDVYPPDQWCPWVDDWRWEPTIEPNEAEREIVEHNAREEAEIADSEFESDLEYQQWLSSLEASEADLDAMERYYETRSWDFGHDA